MPNKAMMAAINKLVLNQLPNIVASLPGSAGVGFLVH
jgi:hypothetical protein